MTKPAPIQLSLPEPCQQGWEDMQDTNKGKFCLQCNKHVTDFSGWTDAAIYQFFSASPGNVCGRFASFQLNRPISAPPQPKSRLHRYFIALGLSLVFTMPTANARRNFVAPHAFTEFIDSDADFDPPSQYNIDSTGIQASIRIRRMHQPYEFDLKVWDANNVLHVARMDKDGNMKFSQLHPGTYTLKAYYYGSLLRTIKDIEVKQGAYTNVVVKLKMNLLNYPKPPLMSYGCPKF